jgi:hypothetical protein
VLTQLHESVCQAGQDHSHQFEEHCGWSGASDVTKRLSEGRKVSIAGQQLGKNPCAMHGELMGALRVRLQVYGAFIDRCRYKYNPRCLQGPLHPHN